MAVFVVCSPMRGFAAKAGFESENLQTWISGSVDDSTTDSEIVSYSLKSDPKPEESTNTASRANTRKIDHSAVTAPRTNEGTVTEETKTTSTLNGLSYLQGITDADAPDLDVDQSTDYRCVGDSIIKATGIPDRYVAINDYGNKAVDSRNTARSSVLMSGGAKDDNTYMTEPKGGAIDLLDALAKDYESRSDDNSDQENP